MTFIENIWDSPHVQKKKKKKKNIDEKFFFYDAAQDTL